MIISKSPFRVSFAGGGSDLATFYRKDYGAVVSSSIDKYVYLALHRFFEDRYLLKYARTESVATVDEIQHPLIRECLKITRCQEFLEITSFADIPASGSGLGSSSAFCVGLINAITAFQRNLAGKEFLAAKACEVEIERMGEPIGKQDQYASAYGGLNYIRFNADDSVQVTPILLSKGERASLDASLLMFYTGITRKASSVLAEQNQNLESDSDKYDSMCRIRDGADRLASALADGNLNAIGHEMNQGWELKKTMARGISSPELDGIYTEAMAAGALGGKLLGAGGGGFFLFYCPPEKQPGLLAALSRLRQVPIELDREGSRIIFVED
jgi:D-glycero-alpha-D-manno-heptose-7-phosphate kinase